jgi:parallel beta-helix repeat protein
MIRLSAVLACLAANLAFAPPFSIADPVEAFSTPGNSTASESTEGQIFDAKVYGAMGDGLTDDSAALASAVAAATKVHGIIRIPAGTYIATITVTRGGVNIQGAGRDATIIKAPKITASPAPGSVLVIANSSYTTIKDLTIDGNKPERAGDRPTAYSLLVYQSNDCTIENVRVINSTAIGIGISASKRTKVLNSEVDGSAWQNITTLNNRAGGCEGTVISGCRATNPGYDDIQITAVGPVTVENCDLTGGTFAGIYVATGARNVTLKNNTITNCYAGIDVSWGTAGGGSSGPDASEGNVIIGNHVTACQNVGISTASNGTLISNNTISDTGLHATRTYTLLGQRTTIVSGGRGYRVEDILTFVGGRYVKPAQVEVTAVGPGGTVESIILRNGSTAYYLGVYTVPPTNPILVKGGTGIGATLSTTWNTRGLECAGIAIADAQNVALTNNISGNNPGNTAQQYGVALFYQHSKPSHLMMSNNTLSRNVVASIAPLKKR